LDLLPTPGGQRIGRQLVNLKIEIGQRLQQHRVDDAEHGGVGADAEGEGQDSHRREARRSAQRPHGISQITARILQPPERSLASVELLRLLNPSQRALGGEPSLLRRHASTSKLVLRQREMGSELTREVRFRPLRPEEVVESKNEPS